MRTIGKYRVIVGFLVLVLLILSGVTYSAWSETLSLTGIFTTGSFKIEFGDKEDFSANLVTRDGKKINVEDTVQVDAKLLNNNKKANITIKNELLNKMIEQGYILQIKYPLNTTDDSKIKAMNPMEADFSKADKTVTITPTIEIVSNHDLALIKYISEDDFKVIFDIFNEIEVTEDGNYAVVFIKAKSMNSSPQYSIEYENLKAEFPQYTDISYNNPQIIININAEYSFEVDIAAEQFNSGK